MIERIRQEDVSKLIEDGYLTCQKHEKADIYIYNYTKKAQFEKVWNEFTLACRGLITDAEGNVLYRPFEKFFNLEEHKGEIPDTKFSVYEKLDGSLGILYKIDGVPHIATRGSFKSEQAIHATEILQRKYKDVNFDDRFTYLFEIIYPENRIVVDYLNMDDLVLLAILDTKTGERQRTPRTFPMKRAKYYKVKDYKALMEKPRENFEGFVVEWRNGLRLKMKYEEYKRLHWLVSSVNSKTIWELLRDGSDIQKLCDHVPDEFYEWVKYTAQSIENNHAYILLQASEEFRLYHLHRKTDSRKEAAEFFVPSPYKSLLFKWLDQQPIDDVIWKMVEPERSQPFKTILDN